MATTWAIQSDCRFGEGESGCGAPTETEREFVTQYVEAVGDYSVKTITDALEANADKFDGVPDQQKIVPAIQERLCKC